MKRLNNGTLPGSGKTKTSIGRVDNGAQWMGDDSMTSNESRGRQMVRSCSTVTVIGLRQARALSHHSGVTGQSERVDNEDGRDRVDGGE